ncbi:UPF0149 family protein [Aureimonas pseudogalii]|uniref:YecA family protein n=1 Tax=Aureimonas pseudogalii TaxID=1744844 RepID=A0A7W6MLW8_9HYPH|nr:UPF0149 family protein [Aureimonas pseudogalii]MBB4000260.1 uncharacterized protein [Aureimonas pseudogalii]
MSRLPPRLRKLDRLLLNLPDDDGPMLVSELDGYLAGLLVCPDLVVPSQWLPQVWSRDDDEESQPVLDDMGHAQATIGAVMEHYNVVAKGLAVAKPTYTPVLDEDPRSDEVLWELWADGFGRAVDLKPSSWSAIDASGDEEARVALAGLLQLVAIARDEGTLPKEAVHAFDDTAPDLIPRWVLALNAWHLANATGVHAPISSFGKVGRNDPCPCSSGKKYKKCCVLN